MVQDENTVEVEKFFDSHAKDYSKKYSRDDLFYEYFFYERLEKVTQDLDFSNKRILDIGAGTGALYDYLTNELSLKTIDYTATDISAGMLNQSNIPAEKRMVGDFDVLQFSRNYDFIFMLGVTTYMDKEMISKTFDKINSLLSPEGRLIVTFTNKRSLDIFLRSLFRPIAKLFSGKNAILSQGFETYYYSESEVFKMVPNGMETKKVVGLNHTFFPLSRLIPNISVRLAKKIDKTKKMALSSDLLFFIGKKNLIIR